MQSHIKKDSSGIEYYYNPFLDVHSFYSPDRRSIPFQEDPTGSPLKKHTTVQDECYCDFCMGRTEYTTPHKSIIYQESNNTYSFLEYPSTLDNQTKDILFRRQGNLFEIFPYSLWKNKYNFQTPNADKQRISHAFQDESIKNSLEYLLSLKYKKITTSTEEIHRTNQQKMIDCESFYTGFHELLTSGRHYLKNATHSNELFHSGRITWEEHRLINKMIALIMTDMTQKNPHIAFIAIFQNWLAKAGASFEHWHKQILAIDFLGTPLLREIESYKQDPHVYKNYIYSICTQEDLFIAENKYGIAYIDSGSKSGQIVICSKSKNLQPHLHSEEELNGMSDLTHAIFSTFPTLTPYNEEWTYTPFNQNTFKTPWRININVRDGVNAGFENITQHLISSLSLKEYASIIRERLSQNTSHIAPEITIYPRDIQKEDFLY